MSTPTLSIIVCTYNRSFWLRNCLDSLAQQCNENNMVEVLIIDNNSNDETRSVTEEFLRNHSNFRYILEEKQGLSHARNRGYTEARGTYVAYLDDDARAHPDWARSIIDFFESHPKAEGVGGPYFAYSTVKIPDWFPNEYGSHTLGNKTHALQDNEWINGTNMAFRKEALVELRGFDVTLGMSAEKRAYGEETNLVARMKAKKMQVYFCPHIAVDHAILKDKISLRWLLKSQYLSGRDSVTALAHRQSATKYLPLLISGILHSLKIFLTINEKHLKTRIYRSASGLAWKIGFFIKLLEARSNK